MGVPTWEVGYTSATTGMGDHKVHKGHSVAMEKNHTDILRSTVNETLGDTIFIHMLFVADSNLLVWSNFAPKGEISADSNSVFVF
jgi:hypothetical protein